MKIYQNIKIYMPSHSFLSFLSFFCFVLFAWGFFISGVGGGGEGGGGDSKQKLFPIYICCENVTLVLSTKVT